ncbi:related to TRZ1 - tRNase Z, involved in RNA processing [Ustilago sp. UG-2017b]|nr:related to TRZ1 - tRNase Z, involved in RNA processing [Ustilago sp. UG-2017b]
MLGDLRVLHVPSSDTNVLPPVILQFGADRYLFNVGEGTSRSSTQRKANLSRISNIFVSRVGWEAIGGLPGVLMSMADGQRASESLHGPDGLRYALATMRTYAKRDIMKLEVNEIPAISSSSSSASKHVGKPSSSAPVFIDDNLAVYAVPLLPADAAERASKKPKLDREHSSGPSAATIEKVDQLWRKPYFNPSDLHGEQAEAWIRIVSDCIFNDSLLRRRQQEQQQQQSDITNNGASTQVSTSTKLVSSVEDVEMDDLEAQQAPASPRARARSPWRPPLSPAFVTRLLPRPQCDTRYLAADRSDPAEGGQTPVLAFICEAHAQRGKFDPVKATEAGVPPGPSFAALTKGEDITLKRPSTWASMQDDEKKRWIQSQRGGVGSKPKPNSKQNGRGKSKSKSNEVQEPPPAAWNELEEVLVRSSEVLGPSRAGAVVFHVYLPSAAYIYDLLSDNAAQSFSAYTQDANKGLSREQSRTPHAIVHAIPLDVLKDTRYQQWMRRFGPDCHHMIANYDVCANKLMFPSSATIPLRLSKLDEVMFKVPQYQLKPRVSVEQLTAGESDFPLKLVAAEADQVIPLHPRGGPKRYHSGAPDFDFPIQSEEANKVAAFEVEAVEETEQQTQQLVKAKAKNDAASNAKKQKAQANGDASTDDLGAVRNLRLKEARKKAWEDYLDVVKKIKAQTQTASNATPPEKDILVTTLGTGSAAPSKYRNVISTLIHTPSSGNILLDAGESTYGLLRRKFGYRRDGTAAESGSLVGQDVDDILREMRILFISHIHADHHIGLIRLLLERRKLHPRPDKPLYLVGTGFVHNYLEEYEHIEKLGLGEDVILVLSKHLDYKTGVDPLTRANGSANLDPCTAAAEGNSSREPKVRREHLTHVDGIKAFTGLSHVHTARVVHRGSHCYGLVIRHTNQDWSVTYSGDTRPAPELIAAGRDCKLLIHEATLEDGEQEMAVYKGHSTFGEAIRVGHEMGATNILLTHFSQRYPKMARSSLFASSEQIEGKKNVPIALAFDMVTYPLSQFSKIQGYTPAMEALFAADTEAEDEVQSVTAAEPMEGAGSGASNGSKGDGKGQGDTKQSNGNSSKGADVVSVVATSNGESAGETEAKGTKKDTKTHTSTPEPQERYTRKGMKPSEWRYIGLRLSSSSSLASILPAFMLDLVQTAQTATMGAVGGAYNVDILSTHPSNGEGEGKSWDAVVRVEAKHAQDLVTSLSLLPAPSMQNTRVRMKAVGPTTAIQTLQNLLS